MPDVEFVPLVTLEQEQNLKVTVIQSAAKVDPMDIEPLGTPSFVLMKLNRSDEGADIEDIDEGDSDDPQVVNILLM